MVRVLIRGLDSVQEWFFTIVLFVVDSSEPSSSTEEYEQSFEVMVGIIIAYEGRFSPKIL